jgi:hypothetical protein
LEGLECTRYFIVKLRKHCTFPLLLPMKSHPTNPHCTPHHDHHCIVTNLVGKNGQEIYKLFDHIAIQQSKMPIINKQTLNFCGVPHNQFMQITLEKPKVPHKIQLEKVILSPVAGSLHTTWQRLKNLAPRLKLYSHSSRLLMVLVFILE